MAQVDYTQHIIEAGAVPCLRELIAHSNRCVIRSSCASARIILWMQIVAWPAVVDCLRHEINLLLLFCSPMLQGDSEGGVLDPVQHRRGHV